MDMNLVLARAQNAVLSHDWTTAARLYKELLRGEESNIEYLKELGNIYVKAGDDEKAIPYYEQIITLYPHTVDAMNSLGAIYRRLKQYEKSIEILQRALDEDTDRTSVNYNLGFTYKDMGNFIDAIESFESVIAENPNDVLAYNHLGSIYYNQKIYDRSISSFKRGLQVDPNHPILNYNLARCYEADKNYTEAIRCYEITLKTRPGWTDAIRDFSGLLIKCQYNKKAQALVEKSIKLHPSDVELLCILGRIFINQFDYDNATNTYKKAKSIKGNDLDVLLGFSEALEKGAKPDQALEIALEAMEIDPYNKDVRKRYASTLLSNQHYDQAYENIMSLVKETEEKDVQSLDLCAQYYLCRGDEVSAKNYHDKIQAVNHHYKDYLLNAADRCVQIGELEKAEKYAQQYVERRSKLPDGYNRLGIIYQKKGDIETASKYFEKSKSCCDSNVFAENALKAAAEYKREFVLPDSEVAESENEENIVQQEEAVENQTDEQKLVQEEEEPFEFSAFGDKLNAETLAEDNDNFWDEFDDDSEKTELPLSDEEHFTDAEEVSEKDDFDKDIFDTLDGADSIKDKLTADDEEDFSISSLAGNSEPEETVSEEIQNETPAPVTEAPVSEESVMPVNSVPSPVTETPMVEEPSMSANPVLNSDKQNYQPAVAVKYADKAMDAAFMAQKMVQQLSEQQRDFEQALEMRNEQRIHEEVEKAVESKLQSTMDSQMEKIMAAEEEFGNVEEFSDDETENFGDVEDFAGDEPEVAIEEAADEFDTFGTVEEFSGEEAEPVELAESSEEVEVSPEAESEEMTSEEAYGEDEFCRVEDLIGDEAEPADNPYDETDEFDDVSMFAVPEEKYDDDYGTAGTEEEDHFVGVEELLQNQPEFGPEDDFDEVEDFMGEETAVEAEPENEAESSEEIAEGVSATDYEEDDFTGVDEYTDSEETEIVETEVAEAEAETSDTAEEISIPEIELPKGEVDQLELFKTLRVLSNFLPEKEKNSFLSCRIRMMIEYIIAKMSGKPGLLITAKTLLESGALGEEYDAQLTAEAEDDVSNAMITHVLKYMKKLAESLQDTSLSNALCISADNILERIELEDQKSQIF